MGGKRSIYKDRDLSYVFKKIKDRKESVMKKSTISEVLSGVNFFLMFNLYPLVNGWKRISEKSAKGEGTVYEYISGDYQLTLSLQEIDESVEVWRISLRRKNDGSFMVENLGIKCLVPMVGAYKVWHASNISGANISGGDFATELRWKINARSCANTFDPLFLVLNSDGMNSYTVGLFNQTYETKITGGMQRVKEPGHQNQMYELNFSRFYPVGINPTFSHFEDAIYISKKREDWFDTIRHYSNFVDRERGYKPYSISSIAIEPQWHSWYAFEEYINQEQIYRQAQLAKELGIKTIMVDCGWNDSKNWGAVNESASISPNRETFPNFEKMVKDIKGIGMNVMLRWTPFHLSREVDRRLLAKTADETLPYPCLRNPEVQDKIVWAAKKIFQDYEVDGLWYDTLDGINPDLVCTGGHKHNYATLGEGVNEVLKRIRKAVNDINPNALLIFRRSHANINNKPYLTHLWPLDSPFDYDKNRREVMVMKSYSSGVLTHACCTCWSPKEEDNVVAKHLASIVLAGVPSISVDLTSIPQSHRQLIKRWFNFYHQHKKELAYGDFKPLMLNFPSAAIKIEGKKEAFVGVFDVIPGNIIFSRAFEKIYLVNCSSNILNTALMDSFSGTFSIRVFNYMWKEVSSTKLESAQGQLQINITCNDCPYIVELEKV